MAELRKTEGGVAYPAHCFLDRPDPQHPSTWGLRTHELVNGQILMTKAQLGRAAAALSPSGFRGNQYKQRPNGKPLDYLRRVLISRYRQLGVKTDDIPSYLFR